MAELVSKKSSNVVSTKKNDVVCGVKSNNGLIDIDNITPSNNQLLKLCEDEDEDDLILTNNTKNELSADDKSLQELIESELALRICSNDADDVEVIGNDEEINQQEISIKKIVIEPRQDLLDINAEFIGAEIDHYNIVEDPYTYRNGHTNQNYDDLRSPELKEPIDLIDTDVDEVFCDNVHAPTIRSSISATESLLDFENQEKIVDINEPASQNQEEEVNDEVDLVNFNDDVQTWMEPVIPANGEQVGQFSDDFDADVERKPIENVNGDLAGPVDDIFIEELEQPEVTDNKVIEFEEEALDVDVLDKTSGVTNDVDVFGPLIDENNHDLMQKFAEDECNELWKERDIEITEVSNIKAANISESETEILEDLIDPMQQINEEINLRSETDAIILEDNKNNDINPESSFAETDDFNNQTKTDNCVREKCLNSPTVAPLATPDDESSDFSNSCDSESHEEVITSTVTTSSSKTSTKSKKKKIEGVGNDVSQISTPRTKKTKKSKKSELEKENISVKSSFNKFDALTKKTVLHVRSVDAAKVQQQLNSVGQNGDANPNCRSCGKVVFQMEQTKAEGLVWHKNCFRCVQCSKQLNVDNYESNECILYCKAHFKELFQPKPVEESDQPASDKPDLGLEELSSLNVKSRFQVFEKTECEKNEIERSPSQVAVKRSPSILSKLAKFQAKGMDIGVADESLNGIPYEESSESEEEEEIEETEETEIVKSKRTTRERPMSFSKMDDMKNRWEVTSQQGRRESQREARKEEIAGIRSRLFMGKQGKMKEMYQQAVATSEKVMKINPAEEIQNSAHAKSIKERFERGEPIAASDDENDSKPKQEKPDEEVIAAGISRKSRSLFLELDATAAKTGRPVTPVNPKTPTETPRRARDVNSPEREIYRDPDVVRADDRVDEVVHTDTARKMLSIFRQMEEKATKEDLPDGPKPLKRFTPPPEDKFAKPTASDSDEDEEEDGEESGSDEERDPNYVRASDKVEDEFLKQAQNAVMAKTLRAKFEHWEEVDGKTTSHHVAEMDLAQTADGEQQSIESARSLRARFESLGSQPSEAPRVAKVKVNRFVEIQTACTDVCESCQKKVYPLEKVETNNKIFHKQCFRCLQCNCVLRMDTFTLNNGKLYCIPHFKQLFIARGNYDEGFGVDPHKNKWSTTTTNSSTTGSAPIVANGGATPVINQV